MKFKISKWLMLCLFILNVEMTQAQKNDYVWPMGSHGFGTLEQTLEDSISKEFWPFSLNFNNDPMQIDYFPKRRFVFHATNGSYSRDDAHYSAIPMGWRFLVGMIQ
ncbi:MAG: hypothetical protein IPO48_04435 [Saprospiraceae bacterium]|nr:hypothetical protein [Saprospiraceae bacterium]